MVALRDGASELHDNSLLGADICVEVVSPESEHRDYATKFLEYEAAGGREYWIIDPTRRDARFHRLSEQNTYQTVTVDEEYRTPLLPGLVLRVPMLWEPNLPGPLAIGDMLRATLDE